MRVFIALLVLFTILWFILGRPSLFSGNVETMTGPREPRPKRDTKPTPEGLRTKEELNRMLSEEINELKSINVPISDSISPEVVVIASHKCYGECHYKGSWANDTGYDYVIALSAYTLISSEKSLRNTIIHELIHTVPEGYTHKGQWKKWADYASEKLGYNIQHYDGDKTKDDKQNLIDRFRLPRGLVKRRKASKEAEPNIEEAPLVWCPNCYFDWQDAAARKSGKVPETCPKCGANLRHSTPEEIVKEFND